MLKKKAVQNPSTLKPVTISPANRIMAALMIKRKTPRVRIVIGIVRITRMGLTIEFSNERTAATKMAVNTESIWTPLSK